MEYCERTGMDGGAKKSWNIDSIYDAILESANKNYEIID